MSLKEMSPDFIVSYSNLVFAPRGISAGSKHEGCAIYDAEFMKGTIILKPF